MMMAASAIVLAGGQSRRMGTPKPALMFGNSTILERIISELSGWFGEILVVAAPAASESFPVEQILRAAPSSVRLLRDVMPHEGAAIALGRGLVASANDVAFACSCDLPLIQGAVAQALCGMLNGYEAVIPDIGGRPQPLCAVYRRAAARVIEAQFASGERRLTQIIAALPACRPLESELRKIDPALHSFFNVNTPEDYYRALTIVQS
jgi:molybdopterin-guanine dinucleotide biosynthesis protein A